jgi:hypothetical protein
MLLVAGRPAAVAVLAMAATLAFGRALSFTQTPASPAIRLDVSHYAASIEPNLSQQSIAGTVEIHFTAVTAGQTIEFDSGALTVDSVREGSTGLAFEKQGSRLRITLARPAAAGESARSGSVSRHASPEHSIRSGRHVRVHVVLHQSVAGVRRCAERQGDTRSRVDPPAGSQCRREWPPDRTARVAGWQGRHHVAGARRDAVVHVRG